MRTHRYREIGDDLRRRIEAGEFAAGMLLPSEAALGAAYGASRITVRKALDLLRADGLVASRQGFGWLVAGEPLRQSLGHLGTIEAQLAASGRVPERRVLDFGFVAPPATVVAAGFGDGSVLAVRRLNLASGVPFALVTVWCPAAHGRRLSRDDVEAATFYELLEGQGVVLGGATQTIAAGVADDDEAALLGVAPGVPVLRCRRVTRTADDAVVLVSEHVFPSHLTEFVVDLPRTDRSMAPSGLRLVDECATSAPGGHGPSRAR